MRLTELNPEFLKRDDEWHCHIVPTLAEADGMLMLCPVCFQKNKGSAGTHSIKNWFRGKVPDDATPGPGRWTPQGTGFDDLTFVPGYPPMATSVLLQGSQCGAHFLIQNGEIKLC